MKQVFGQIRSITCALTISASVAGCSESQDSSSSETNKNWEGLWIAERHFGPNLNGPINIQQTEEGWIAKLRGETVSVERRTHDNGTIRWSFKYPNWGHFEGWQEDDEAKITGHWIQPPGALEGYPFATPVYFSETNNGDFTGELAPFEHEVSFNIPMTVVDGASAGSGKYQAFLRNPQRNLGVFARIERAQVIDGEIRFTGGSDDTLIAVGNITEPGERFSLLSGRFNSNFDFRRRTRDNAPGFYPRRLPENTGSLLRPIELDDGWPTSSPEASGLDTKRLSDLIGSIANFEPNELRQPYIHSLLVAHKGKLVVEEYFHDHHRDMPHDSRSAGKTVGSTLLGIALRKGVFSDLDQPVYPLFGGVDAFANPDPRKEQMTLRHLVTMTQGFDCDDDDFDTPGNEDVMQGQSEEPDWYRYALSLPMVRSPGEKGVYCTAGINLVGGAIQRKTGENLGEFFHREFAEPLGIKYYQLNLSPTEEAYMGGGLRLKPRDFMKMGQLYLNGGIWNGKRIVSEDWAEESAKPHATLYQADDYGLAWWHSTYEVEGQDIHTYYASGNGGQMLFVVPELELVIMINAGNYSDGRTRNQFREKYMREFILPAALNAK
jgi:CubicO group peptidase (beta-lactamase class C family)